MTLETDVRNESDTTDTIQRFNNLYIVTGPPGVGKSVILEEWLSHLDDAKFCVKTTTRDRRKGEKKGRDLHFVTEQEFQEMKNDFIFEYELFGNSYGVPASILDDLEAGNDVFVVVSSYEKFAQMEKRFPDAVPVFIYANLDELRDRLAKREVPQEELAIRLNAIPSQLKKFKRNRGIFKYIVYNPKPISLTDLGPEREDIKEEINETVRRLLAIVQREREANSKGDDYSEYHKNYVNDLAERLFGYDFYELTRMLEGKKKVVLEFDSETIGEYSERREIHTRVINKHLPRKVISAVKAYGRATILLESPTGLLELQEDGILGREIILDLVEGALANYLPDSRDPQPRSFSMSLDGLIGASGERIFNDGLSYRLTDDIALPRKNLSPRALNIGFVAGDYSVQQKLEPLSRIQIIYHREVSKSGMERHRRFLGSTQF